MCRCPSPPFSKAQQFVVLAGGDPADRDPVPVSSQLSNQLVYQANVLLARLLSRVLIVSAAVLLLVSSVILYSFSTGNVCNACTIAASSPEYGFCSAITPSVTGEGL
jgi:hypothetical protein